MLFLETFLPLQVATTEVLRALIGPGRDIAIQTLDTCRLIARKAAKDVLQHLPVSYSFHPLLALF